MKYKKILYNQLKNNIEPDCEDFYLCEIEEKAKKYDELIDYLKEQITLCQNKIKEYKIQQREFIYWLGNLLVSEFDVFTEIKVCDVLSKYKEIIGGKNK